MLFRGQSALHRDGDRASVLFPVLENIFFCLTTVSWLQSGIFFHILQRENCLSICIAATCGSWNRAQSHGSSDTGVHACAHTRACESARQINDGRDALRLCLTRLEGGVTSVLSAARVIWWHSGSSEKHCCLLLFCTFLKINQPNKAIYQLCCENTGSLLGSRVEILTIPIPGSQVLESLGANWPTGLKLKRSGSSRPLGRRVLGWRSSSKKACAHASRGDSLVTGVYSSSREQRAMASGGVRGLNTWQEVDILANMLANHSEWD